MNTETSVQHVANRGHGWLPHPLIAAIVLVNLALAVGVITAFARFGSVQSALGYCLRGETLFFDAKEQSLGVVAAGQTVTASFRLTNGGRNSIRILGCAVGCACTAPRNLPFALRVGESRDFVVTVRVPTEEQIKNRESAVFELSLTLFTSSATQSRVPLTIKGRVGGGLVAGGPG